MNLFQRLLVRDTLCPQASFSAQPLSEDIPARIISSTKRMLLAMTVLEEKTGGGGREKRNFNDCGMQPTSCLPPSYYFPYSLLDMYASYLPPHRNPRKLPSPIICLLHPLPTRFPSSCFGLQKSRAKLSQPDEKEALLSATGLTAQQICEGLQAKPFKSQVFLLLTANFC